MCDFPFKLRRRGSPSFFISSSGGLRFSQYVDLLEESGLNTSRCVFFKGSRLVESTHLLLLFFHPLLQAVKHLKELLIGVLWFGRDCKGPLRRGERRLGTFSVDDVDVR